MKESTRLILASGSPRRTELLHRAGFSHEVIVSGADEDVNERDPRRMVEALSARKAQEVLDRVVGNERETSGSAPDAIRDEKDSSAVSSVVVIGADTVVALDGTILGKPADEEDAARMLHLLSGRTHHVFTGVTLIAQREDGQKTRTFSEESLVHVDALTEEEIHAYIATGEPMDKAGSYGIQGWFMKHITGIEGDYFNIVGLPVSHLYRELKEI